MLLWLEWVRDTVPPGVGIFHRSDSFLLISLEDSRSPALCALFLTCCEATEFAETGHKREERLDQPVSLLMGLHALQLECEKSIELTASSNRSCFFCSSRESRDQAALSESVPTSPVCTKTEMLLYKLVEKYVRMLP